jgi:plasmid stabilization system protein ParE
MFLIKWTDPAEAELFQTSEYIFNFFSIRELVALTAELEHTLALISENPNTFKPLEGFDNMRQVVIMKYNTLYYKIDSEQELVFIVSFFSNRQHPDKKKLNS